MIQNVFTGAQDPRAFKDLLGKCIPELCEKDADVVYLDADLMSCIGTAKYGQQHPDRAINCGIAEANMVGVACGMSAVGFYPIIHTFGPFASRRVYDQVFLSGAYAGNTVTILGTDPGITAAYNGGTHMPFEDLALYRAMPTATVLDLTDTVMLEALLDKIVHMPGVKYLRMGRKTNMLVYGPDSEFEIGKGIPLREGKDAVIFACGIMVGEALNAAKALADEGIDAAVVDLFTVKPLDEELVIRMAKATGAVVTAENHNKYGGLTSAVSEVLSLHCPTPLEYVAVEDVFGEVGAQPYLREQFNLTAEHIVEKVKKAVSRK